jgi:hypothetical protein
MLRPGIDITVIALWLGHESTRTTMTYLKADLELKQRALDRTAPHGQPGPGRCRRECGRPVRWRAGRW